MRVVGYVRVSTELQAGHGTGLDIQREAILKWARASGHKLGGFFSDEGISGTKDLDARNGLADALGAIRSGEAAGVVVYRLDRLARDLVLQEQLLAEVRRMGGQLFSTVDSETAFLNDDPSDPSRKLIRQVLGAVAEYERSMIFMRLHAGRRRKREQGGYAGGGIPFGFKTEHGGLVPHDREQAALDRLRQLHSEGLSTRAIARALESEGFTPRNATSWDSSTISRLVRR